MTWRLSFHLISPSPNSRSLPKCVSEWVCVCACDPIFSADYIQVIVIGLPHRGLYNKEGQNRRFQGKPGKQFCYFGSSLLEPKLIQNWHLYYLTSPTTKKWPLSTQTCQTLDSNVISWKAKITKCSGHHGKKPWWWFLGCKILFLPGMTKNGQIKWTLQSYP